MGVIWGTATGSNADRVNVWIEWYEGTPPDYANNRSYVSARFYAQTKSTASSTTYDNNGGDSDFYVNGTRKSGLVNEAIDFRSASPYNRPLNLLGSWEDWVYRDGNGNAAITFSGSFSLSSSYISGGSATGTATLATIWTAATAPSNLRFDQNVFETSPTFRWNAGSGGVNNAIQGYRVYYRLNQGSESSHDVANVTSWSPDGSGWVRGTEVDFSVRAITQKGDNPLSSGWSNKATKNRLPNAPTHVSLSKAVYVPGEAVRVNFTNNGDPDNNLTGFEVETSGSTVTIKNESSTATYVEIPTAGWTPGVNYTFRVHAYDALGACSAWSGPVSALVGLPMKLFTTEGSAYKQAAQMKLFVTEGGPAKTVKSMNITTTQGSEFKTVF